MKRQDLFDKVAATKTETIIINGNEFVRTYSTTGKYIERDGIKYSEAIDLPNMGYVYIESEDYYQEDATEDDYIVALAELGVQ